MDIIQNARSQGRATLTEYEAKTLLARYGIPTTRETLVKDKESLADALERIGFPVVLKGIAPDIAHKTERGLVRIGIRDRAEAETAFDSMMKTMDSADAAVLVQEMILGSRELMAGLTRDAQFGPCVMFGLGGIFTEVLEDVAFRMAPLEKHDALDMMREIRASKILGPVRGMEPVDEDLLANILVAVGQIAMDHEEILEIDVNPLIVRDGKPAAVDALMVLSP